MRWPRLVKAIVALAVLFGVIGLSYSLREMRALFSDQVSGQAEFSASTWDVSPTPTTTPDANNCTYTMGYWKNHPEAWPVEEITIGGLTFAKAAAIAILETPPGGDATYILARQLIPAKLNVLKGADPSAIKATITGADDWLGEHPLGSDPSNPDRDQGIALAGALDEYNNGVIGPGRCGDETATPTPEETRERTLHPTEGPTTGPTEEPTEKPTATPTATPTTEPHNTPTPTATPTTEPADEPTPEPSTTPTATATPTTEPHNTPTPTATPTTEPTATPTATATPTLPPDTPTPTPVPETPTPEPPTPTPTVEPSPRPTPQPTCSQVIVNASFESQDGWMLGSIPFLPAYSQAQARSGGWSMRLGIEPGVEDVETLSWVEQNISIPTSAPGAVLSFWRYWLSGDKGDDYFYVSVKDEADNWHILAQEYDGQPDWAESQVDLPGFAGQTITLRFGVDNDGTGGVTAVYLDDVTLEICVP